jgi:hypothetical protein
VVQKKFVSSSSALLVVLSAACATVTTHTQNESQPPLAAAAKLSTPAPARAPDSAPVTAPEAIASAESVPLTAAASDVALPQASLAEAQAAAQRADDIARYRDEVTLQGQRAHGAYFNAPMSRRLGVEGIVRILKGSRLDAAVIDVKDDQGRISFDTQIPELAQSRHVFIADMPEFVRQLKQAGIYTIARIVCFNDPILPKLYPDRAVIDTRPGHVGQVWNLHKGRNTWLNPYNEKNHDLLIALAREVQSAGFDEIQLDYVRFPVDEGTKFAMFPGEGEKPRRDALLSMLRRMDEALHIPIGTDVFGLTAFKHGDPAGLGQSLEDWAAHVDVFSPMLYVNGMKGWLSRTDKERAGLLVAAGVRTLRERVGPQPVIRPFLQAFEEGADYYNGEFIAEQIRGARSGGGDGFLFWHPGSNYGMVRQGMAGACGEVPFRIDERRAARERGLDREQVASGPSLDASNAPSPATAAQSGERPLAAPQGS